MANSAVVGTLRAILSADTAEFASAMKSASAAAEKTAQDVQKSGQAFATLEPRMASVTRLVKDFSGSLERRSAEEFAMAIDKIGGAAKLSESELRRAQGVFSDFISKAKAMGTEIPPHIAKLSSEIDKLHPTTSKAASGVGFLDQAWVKLTGAFSAGLIIDRVISGIANFGREAIATAGNLVDLSAKTGLSTRALQIYGQAAKETGGSIENIADAVFKLGVNVEGGGKRMSDALAKLGLSLEQVKSLKPEQQFELIAQKLQVMTSEQERNRIGVDLFGRSWAAVAPAVVEGLDQIADKTTIVSDEQIRALDAASDAWERFVENRKKDVTSILGSIVIIGQKLIDFSEQAERSAADIGHGFANAKAGFDLGTQAMKAFEAERRRILGGGGGKDVHLPIEIPPDFVQQLKDAQKEVDGLTKAQREQIDAALKVGKAWDDLPPKLRLSEDAQKLYTSATKDGTKAIKAMTTEFDRWSDTVTGRGVQREVDELADNFLRLAKEGKVTAGVVEQVWKQLGPLVEKGAKLPPLLSLVNQEFVRFNTTGKSFFETFGKGSGVIEKFTVDFIDFNEVGKSFFETFGPLAKDFETFTIGAEESVEASKGWSVSLDDAANSLMRFGQDFQAVGAIIGGQSGDITAAVGGIAVGLGRIAAGDWVGGAIQAAGSLASIKTLWSNVARSMQDTFATQLLGFEHLNALMQRLKDMGQIDLVNAGDRAQREDDEEATRQWMADVLAFFEEVDAMFAGLTTAAEAFGGKAPLALQPFIQELLRMNTLTEEQRDLLTGLAGAPEWEQLQSIAQKYGIELGALGQSFQQARIGDIALQYARDFMTLRDAGGDVNGLLIGMQDEVQQLVKDARLFGTALPEAMRPVIEGLISMGLLTDENGNKFEDLASTGLSFTGTLEDAFKDMKSILEEIRDLLAGGLPRAAATGGQEVEKSFSGVFSRLKNQVENTRFVIPVDFEQGSFSPPEGFGLTPLAEGGITTRTTPALLHPGEAVIPLDQMGLLSESVRIDNRLFIDGREVTTSVIRHLREEARRQGVRPI